QQQRKGRRINEGRLRCPELLRPIRASQLVGDQLIGRVRIGNAQQSLGETHHRDALVRPEVVGVEESIDAARLVRADALYQRSRSGIGGVGMLSGGRFDSTAPVDASMSAVSSSPEKGSRCCVMNSGSTGGGAGSSWSCARISTRVTSSRIAISRRSNSRNASCL